MVGWGRAWEGITMKHKETLGGDGYVLYIVCVDGFTGVYISLRCIKLYT